VSEKQQFTRNLPLACKLLLNRQLQLNRNDVLKCFLRERESFRFPEQDFECNKLSYIQRGKFQKLNYVTNRRVEIKIKAHMTVVLLCVSGKIWSSLCGVFCGHRSYVFPLLFKGKFLDS
jgi:hypothetical protein